MPVRVFSRSDHAAGLVTPRQIFVRRCDRGSSTRDWEVRQQAPAGWVSAVMISASLDWAAMTIAAALVTEEEESVPRNGSGLVRAQGLVRR